MVTRPKFGTKVVKWYSAILGLALDILDMSVDFPTDETNYSTSATSFNSSAGSAFAGVHQVPRMSGLVLWKF